MRAALEQFVHDLAGDAERLLDAEVLAEEHDYDGGVAVVRTNRRQVAPSSCAGPSKRLDLQKLSSDTDIPRLLTERAPLAAVVESDELLGDVANRIVEGPYDPAFPELPLGTRP